MAKHIQPVLLSIAAGLCYFLAFPDMDQWIWIFLLPFFLMWVVEKASSWKQALLFGHLAGFTAVFFGYQWIPFVSQEFGGLPASFAYVILFLFSNFGEIGLPIFTLSLFLIYQKFPHTKENWFFPAALFTFIEIVTPKIFPASISHALHPVPELLGVLDLFGLHGLEFLIFWTGSTIFFIFHSYLKTKQFTIHVVSLGLLLVTFVGTIFYSIKRDITIKEAQVIAPKVRVGLVQGNIGNIDKLAAEKGVGMALADTIQTYEIATMNAAKADPEIELFVWPETAYPKTLFNEYAKRPVSEFVSELNASVLVGGYDTTFIDGEELDYNAIFSFTRTGKWIQTYRKAILLAFGEYFPGSETFPSLKNLVPAISHFGRGPGPEILMAKELKGDISEVKMGPMICYEAIIPSFVRDLMKLNPQIFLNLTNDSWFGMGAEAYQHRVLALYRTIEMRRAMIRSTNTGITEIFDARGQTISRGGINKVEVIVGDVPALDLPPTFYARFGEWPLFLIFGFFLGGFNWVERKTQKPVDKKI